MFKTTLYHTRDVGKVEPGREKEVRPWTACVQYNMFSFSLCCILGLMSCIWPEGRAHIIANFASASPDTNSGWNEYEDNYP